MTRRLLTYLLTIGGVALFVHLILRVGPAAILSAIHQIGWWVLVTIVLGGCNLLVRSVAWRFTLGRDYRHISLWRLFRVYVSAESLGGLFFGGPAVVDTARGAMVRGQVATPQLISSVTLDRGLYLISAAVVVVLSTVLFPFMLHRGGSLPRYAYVVSVIYCAVLAALWIAMRKRLRLISGFFFLLSKLGLLRSWLERHRPEALKVEDALFHFLETDRAGFWWACALNLAAQCVLACEVLLLLWLLGGHSSVLTALFVEGMTKIVNLSGAAVPGNVGIYEAGNMVILSMLGFPKAVGLALALGRDVRRIFWLGAGVALLAVAGLRRVPGA